jgi:hypothetical protein
MAHIPASFSASGTRVHYHTTSRTRLSDVTADALRSAAVRLPTDDLRQTAPWFARGHLKLSSEARLLLPSIMGGTHHDVSYDVSAAFRGAFLRAAESGTMRRALTSTMHIDSMGFADPECDGRPAPRPHLRELSAAREGEEDGSGHGRESSTPRGVLSARATASLRLP